MRSRPAILAVGVALLVALAATPAAPAAPTITERSVPGTGQPYGLTLGADGALWLTQTGGSGSGIARLTPADVLTQWGLPGTNAQPRHIVTGPDGNLWFAEDHANRIGRIAPDGTIAEWDVPTKSSSPHGIVAGPDGNLWFTEPGAGKVGRITPTGTITEFALPSGGAPHGIAAGPDGNLWVADSGAERILRVTTAGVATAFAVPTAASDPTGIAAGPDGNLWFTEKAAGRIGRVTPAGKVTEFPLPTATVQPEGIAAGPDGVLWFTEAGASSLGRITTSGVVTELPTGGSATMVAPGNGGTMWFTRSSAVARITTPPAALTGAASGLAQTAATVAGTVTPTAEAASGRVEYGPTTAYGKASAVQAVGAAGPQAVTVALAGLTPGTTYHYRVVGVSPSGETAGADRTFATLAADPPKVTISSAPIAVGASGVAKVEVACPATAVDGCRGKVVLRLATAPRGRSAQVLAVATRCARGCRTLGQAKYVASRGKTRRVSVRMSRSGKRLVRTKKALWTKVSVTTRAGGETKTTSRTVRLRRAK